MQEKKNDKQLIKTIYQLKLPKIKSFYQLFRNFNVMLVVLGTSLPY